jgi:hypothetical protein
MSKQWRMCGLNWSHWVQMSPWLSWKILWNERYYRQLSLTPAVCMVVSISCTAGIISLVLPSLWSTFFICCSSIATYFWHHLFSCSVHFWTLPQFISCNALSKLHYIIIDSFWNFVPCEEIYNWRMASSGILCHVALVRTDVSDKLSTSFIRVTRICELGTNLMKEALRTSETSVLTRATWRISSQRASVASYSQRFS